jgi:lysophospholipase L1-like esterase
MARQAKRTLLMWCVSLMTFAVGLLLLETAARFLYLAPPPLEQAARRYVRDPWLPFKPLPLSTNAGRSVTKEFDYLYVHNSQGFRDVEHSLAKPAGIFRILVLGDSFTYGVGARSEETYPSQLAGLLNQRGASHPRIEIINTGIPRYWTEPERALLEHYGLKYAPDLVLVAFCPNDVLDTFCGRDDVIISDYGYMITRDAAKLGPTALFLYEHSGICRILLRRYVASQRSKRPLPRLDEIYRADGFHEKDWRAIEAEFGRMSELCRSNNVRLVLVHLPGDGFEERKSYPARRLSEWCANHQTQFIDILPAMKKASAGGVPLYYEKDGHCRPAGYRVVAQTLFNELVEAGSVP